MVRGCKITILSDEEIKTIENLKIEYENLIKKDNILFPLYKSDAKRLIDIIEKQQKEIEEKNMHITKETVDFINSHYIHKAKIKAKIEELDEEIKIKREIAKNPMDRVSGRLLTDSIVELEKNKKVLQSLLEKE